jgi:hypothetical protein
MSIKCHERTFQFFAHYCRFQRGQRIGSRDVRFPPRADINPQIVDVRFVPIAGLASDY